MYANTPKRGHGVKAKGIEQRSGREIVRLGKEIYERDIRPMVEPDHIGKFVAIDVDTGMWTMSDDEFDVSKRLREKRPEAVNVMSERVGYKAVARPGFTYQLRTD